MKEVKIVTGAVFNTDSEEVITDYFGHNLSDPDAATYFADDFIINPILFCEEKSKLAEAGIRPLVYMHEDCRIVTPYDVIIARCIEDRRGFSQTNRYIVGVNEAITRYEEIGAPCAGLTAGKALKRPIERIVSYIRTHWVPKRLIALDITKLTRVEMELILSNSIIPKWINQLVEMLNYCSIANKPPTYH